MKVAVVVGHSEASQGAVSVSGEQEWSWQRPLASQLVTELGARDLEARVFYRPNGGYTRSMRKLCDRINAYDPDLVVSLHFNAFPEAPGQAEVVGTMALHWPTSRQGKRWAVQLSAACARAQGTRDRGARQQAKSWSGATLWILALTRAPAVILETHYGDARSDHDKATATRDSGATASALADCIAGAK